MEEEKDVIQEIDIAKIISILVKSIIWIILLLIAFNIIGYLYLRWTYKIYESSSVLKIEQKNEGSALGIYKFAGNSSGNELQGEIELIRSNIIYDKVIKDLNLYISYNRMGNILNEEIFGTSSIMVDSFEIIDNSIYNQKVFINFLDEKNYKLTIVRGKEKFEFVQEFNKLTSNPYLKLNLSYLGSLEAHENTDYFINFYSDDYLRSYLSRNLEIQPNQQTNTIKIIFKDNNPKKAQGIVNAIDEAYLFYTLEAKKQINEQTIAYLESQIQRTGSLLQSSMDESQEFSTTNMTVNVKSDFINSITKINTIEDELIQKEYDLKVLFKVQELVKEEKIDESLRYLSIFGFTEFTPQFEKYKEINKNVEKLEYSSTSKTLAYKINNDKFSTVLKDLKDGIDNYIETTRLDILELRKIKNSSNEELYKLPEKLIESDRIDRNFKLHEDFYMMLNKKKIEYEIAQAGIVPEFKILSKASLSSSPISPIPSLIYIYCSVIALAIGFGIVVLRYFLHNTITSQKDVEKLTNVPISGITPRYSTTKMEVSQLVVDKNPKSMVSEAFRTIRTNLEFISSFKGKLLSVTSTISGEGKTFVSINLAASIAQSGLKIVLLDLDMRKPKIHLAFNHDNIKGMSTILSGKTTIEECILPTPVLGYDFISAGPTPPNPSELILRDDFDRVIQELKKKYDVIMIDTPPTGLVTDGVLIMKKIDIPLYVVRSEYTKLGFEKNINKLYYKHDFKNLSIIINSIKNGGNNYGYGYGYGYGYYDEEKKKPNFFEKLFNKK